MGTTWLGGTPAIETEPIQNHEVYHLRAKVDPDGSAVTLAIRTDQGQIDLEVPIDRMPTAVSEMKEAGDLMMRRQLHCLDKGQSVIRSLVRKAATPTTITPTIDHLTGDCVIVYRFVDQMPFVVRLSMEQLHQVRANFALEVSRLSH